MEDVYIGQFLDNRYEILEKIGSGGMAVVYKARCHRLNRFVAIKILKSDLAQDAELRKRFHAESQAVAMLSHPNIVAVYDVSHSDNIDYIVMELIEGITLKQYINRKGILNWKEALHFTTQIAKALSHAHSRGIIHRDIKPHNIMILKDGSVKVADFGIARLLSTQNTLTQEALGSVHYISPEQAKGGAVDARSDIYSVGVVMYEMLTSRLPFEGDSAVSIAIQHISSIPLMPREINPDIPAGLEDITMHAMEPNLDARYPSADALLADLEEFRKNPSIRFNYSSVPSSSDGDDVDSTKVIPTGVIGSIKSHETPVKRSSGNAISRDRNTKEDYRKNRRKASSTTTLVGIFCIIVFLIGLVWFMWNYAIKDWLNPQDERISVDNFVGMYLDNVMGNSSYEKIYDFTVENVVSEEYEEGYIISQDPAAERSVVVSDSKIDVTLTVSAGKNEVTMPGILNKDYRDAESLIRSLDVDVNIEINAEPSEDVTQGYVIEQYPDEGVMLYDGATVYITYSSGVEVPLVPVPNVTNMSLEQAILRLQSYDLSYSEEYAFSDDVEEGYVMFQSYEAGEEVPIHTKVVLQVSQGPEKVEAPVVNEPDTNTGTENQGSDSGQDTSDDGSSETGTGTTEPGTPATGSGNGGAEIPQTGNTSSNQGDQGIVIPPDDMVPDEEGILPNG